VATPQNVFNKGNIMNKQVDVKNVPKIEVVGQAPPAKVVP
jgi:hypothetical protein